MARKFGEFNGIEYVLYTKNDVEGAEKVLDTFYDEEPVCSGTEINLPESVMARQELTKLCHETSKDGISLLAKDVKTGEVVGVAFNKLQCVPENDQEFSLAQFEKECVKSKGAAALIKFMVDVEQADNVFNLYKAKSLIDIMFLASAKTHRGLSIGLHLCEFSIDLAKELKNGKSLEILPIELKSARPSIVTAIFTSKYSQAIGKKLDFTVIRQNNYENRMYKEKSFASRIDPGQPKWEYVVKEL